MIIMDIFMIYFLGNKLELLRKNDIQNLQHMLIELQLHKDQEHCFLIYLLKKEMQTELLVLKLIKSQQLSFIN